MDLVTLALAKSYIDKRINEGEIAAGATPQQAAQIEQNKTDIAVLQTEVNELKESGGNSSGENAVLYTEQELTAEQQEQARTNIGAVSVEEVEALINGEDVGFSETGELVELNVEAETALEVISKIHRDETWGESNKLVLHQVCGSNFVDMTSFLGGIGNVFEQNGLTATINADSTVTIRGTNESTSRTTIINQYHWSGEQSAKVYPAGTYTIPKGFTMAVRAAQYPKNVAITGLGNLSNTVTISEPFRIIMMQYGVGAGNTVDVTLPLGLFRGSSIPETEFEYSGILHTVTFDMPVYEGEFNWKTGELKDVNGDIIAYYDPCDITSLPGTNYFWTCFGENTVSNTSNDLGKVILRLNEPAPEDAIASICDFMLTPNTPKATYCLHSAKVRNGGAFFKHEIPLITTKGNLTISDSNGEILTEKYVDSLINWKGVSDSFTNKGIRKTWSDRFYFTKEPVAHEDFTYDGGITNALYTFEFTEEDFQNTGIPAKLDNIPIVSPCFYTRADAADKLNSRLFGGDVFPATFSWDDETGKYIFKMRGLYPEYIMDQLQRYTKAYFCYQLATPYDIPATVAMGISSGDTVMFAVDDSDWSAYIDGDLYVEDIVDATPTCSIFVPRNPVDACEGMMNAARMLNKSGTVSGDVTVQGYSWIGAGDGVTDYTAKIQNKLDVLHTTSGGGTIHLGPGTYPISNSLIVYGNTKIIGDGHTIIEQRADNTHAVIWSGNNIQMQDLTIKLAGKCTDITACIYANSNNISNGNFDDRYPENASVQYCTTVNVTLKGDYKFSWSDGYPYLSDESLEYRGVGIGSPGLYFNYHDASRLVCRNLYSGIYNGGGSNNYRLYVTNSRYAVYGGGANNIFEIIGHTYYDYDKDNRRIIGTEYAYYGTDSDNNMITIEFYDSQFARGTIFFEGNSQNNHYRILPSTTGMSTSISYNWGGEGFAKVTDYGRNNSSIQPFRERFVGVGSCLPAISGLPIWNTQFNPSVHNALSGAGVWGTITSNVEWTSKHNISLQDICRYPKETGKTGLGLASIKSTVAPTEDSPIEIIIDISDRPVSNYYGFWIQFDHMYVAEEYTVSFDTNNDGTFDLEVYSIKGNNEPVSYGFNYQKAPQMVYRIKFSITKALQIPEFTYSTADYTKHTIDYNPDGLIGIVNIGMPSNEAYGRAFLGECGGSLYGNVDMHSNTLKNLSTPVDDGDAVSKSYLEEKLAEMEAKLAALTEIVNGT